MSASHTIEPATSEGKILERWKREIEKKGKGENDPANFTRLCNEYLLRDDEDNASGVRLLQEMGKMLAEAGCFLFALDAYQRSLNFATLIADTPLISRAHEAMGILYARNGDYPAALQCYHAALRIQESGTDALRSGITWLEIGVVYGKIGEADRALDCFSKSAQIFESAHNLYLKVKAMVNIANVLQVKGELEPALDYMLRALMIFDELDDRENVGGALAIISNIQGRMGNFDASLDYGRRALEVIDPEKNPMLHSSVLLALSRLCFAMQQDDVAISAINRAFIVIERIGDLRMLCEAHEIAAMIYERSGDLAKALKHHKQLIEARDAYEKQKKETLIAEIQMRFDLEQMEKERNRYRDEARELQRELFDKNRELTSASLNLVQKSEFLDDLKHQLSHILTESQERSKSIVKPILDDIAANRDAEDGWRIFEQQFNQVHRDFMRILAERYPSLTPMELKICALSKVDLTTKDIAQMLFVTVRNIQNHRYRIRKKLGLGPEENLVSFLTGI